MAKKKSKSDLHMMIKDVQLPILTLDNQWHRLFPDDQKTETIKVLEQKVNNLLKKQGKLTNDIQEMKTLKKRFIKDIMMNMDIGTDNNSRVKEKKFDKSKQYINEINDKIDKSMDELGDIPYQIRDANAELVSESVNVLYQRFIQNNARINELTRRINQIREELDQMNELKRDLEASNSDLYTYMHDLLGVDLMDILDGKYQTSN